MKIALSLIQVDPALQARENGVVAAVAREYGRLMAAGTVFPPVVVFGPEPDGRFWLADGFHRHAGAEFAGLAELEAEVRPGGRREALFYSVGANASHGLRRSQADKRKAVFTLLGDAEWSMRSDRWIAEAARVSDKTVGTLRKALGTSTAEFRSSTSTAETSPVVRMGKDGKERKKMTLTVDLSSARLIAAENLPSGRVPIILQPDEPMTVSASAPHDPYVEFHRRFDAFLATVPEEKRHLICGQLRNLADDNDPEFQEQQRRVLLHNQEVKLGVKKPKGRAK